MDWSKERVVVTGGAGFIGSHLVDALVKERVPLVHVIDNLSRGHRSNIRGHVNAHLYTDSVLLWDCDFTDWADRYNHGLKLDLFEDAVVFHLAARVTNISSNAKDHLGMLQDNLELNVTMTDFVRRARPKLYIPISTVCVYPHDCPIPTPESAGYPFHPEPTNEGYGLAKAIQEKQGQYLHDELGIPVVVPRFSNAIGPRDYYDWESSHVVPALIRKIHEHDEVVVWGTGQQSRTFVDARDIAKALILLAETPEAHDGRPVNIGPDRSITIADLTFLLMKLADVDKPVRFDTSKPDGHKERAVDNSRLRSLIGWVPNTPLEDTLADMLAEYKAGKSHL